jgi:penicillin amidase
MPSITNQDLQNALPDLTSTFHFSDLSGPVTIHRDPWGIPHIQANSESDLFFAQGFATAQDRLWHMDYDRHRALGRWSEIAGSSAIDQDRLLRSAGMGRTARLDYEASSSESRAMIDAYTAGVNAFISSTKTLPIEYTLLDQQPEPWENWHCITVYKMRNTLLGTFEPKLFRTQLAAILGPEKAAAIIRGYPQGHLLTVPPGEEYTGPPVDGLEALADAAEDARGLAETDVGSNAWSISGDLTESGLPLMGGDSHRALDTPSVYYQVHLSCPEFTVIGHSVPGMPGALHFCHNEHVGWGMTYGNADTQDLFIEHVRQAERGWECEYRGNWEPAQVLEETLSVRGSDPLHIEVLITRHGPVIAGDPATGTVVAISDPGLLGGTPWVDAARDAMRCKSVPELHEAFDKWTDRVNNYAVVDVLGNFGYLHEGKIPIRSESNGWRAVPGWTGDHEWEGYIPHKELPIALNPDCGYAITCNQRVASHDYPYYVGLYFSPEFRARRIQTRILELEKAVPEDMEGIHADRISSPALVFRDALVKVLPVDGSCRQAIDLLKDWDGSMDRDLVQPTIYSQTRLHLTRELITHHLGEMATAALSCAAGAEAHIRLIVLEMILGIQNDDTSFLPDGATWTDCLAIALAESLSFLKKELGEDITTWKWGRLHRTTPTHPLSVLFPGASDLLDPPSLPVHGDGDVPLAGGYAINKPFAVTGLSVNRYIHDPADWSKSRWIVPLGASGHPGSPHYADQAVRWSNVEYIPQLWDWEAIAQQAESRQELLPRE